MKRTLLFMLLTLCLAGCAALAVTPQAPDTVLSQAPQPSTGSLTPSPDHGRIGPSGSAAGAITKTILITSTLVPPVHVTPGLTPTVIVTRTTPTITSTISTTKPTPQPPRPAFVDLGFRPYPNGYQFANYSQSYTNDFTISDTIKMFGNTNVCLGVADACYPRLEFQDFTNYVTQTITVGHCEGFTITSLRYFQGLDKPSAFLPFARTTYRLPFTPNVRKPIAYYWALQIPDPVATAKFNSTLQTPVQILDQLIKAIRDASDPTSLFVYDQNPHVDANAHGHTILPYAVVQVGKEVWRVRVYDNNWPTDPYRYVTITTTLGGSWSYNTGFTTVLSPSLGAVPLIWSGNVSSQSLGAVPLSLYSETPICSLCWTTTGPIATTSGLAEPQLIVSNDPNSQLLVTDSQGRRQGPVNGQGVEEIPGAFRSILPGGLDLPETPIAYLPITDTYTFTLSRPAPISPTQPSEITEFGPGFVAAVSNIILTGTQSSQLHVGSDGTQVVYQSGSTDPVTFGMTVESADESKKFVVAGITVGAGRVLTLTVDDARRRFVVNDASNVGGTYDLTYTRVTTDGQKTFFAPGIIITSTDTQFVNYDAWNGTGPITLTIDSGSTGTITQTITLYNQVAKVYLPLIQK